MELGTGKVSVKMVNEAAFIDLNMASEKLLMSLFQSVGVEAGEAQSLVDAIEDWRDVDDLPRLSGAERDQYQAAGLKQVPANTDFRTVDELKAVMGMTPALFDKVAGSLTVYSKAAGIVSALAPRTVLLAIPEASPEDVDAYIKSRQDQLDSGVLPTGYPRAAGYEAGAYGLVYNLQSEAALPDGTAFLRQAVVRMTGNAKHPFDILDWREVRP
jgi:general secretion pathway protein K